MSQKGAVVRLAVDRVRGSRFREVSGARAGVALTLRDADGGSVVTIRPPTRHKRDRGSPDAK